MAISVTSSVSSPYRHAITAGNHTFYADTTTALGGQDTAPSPHEIFLGALGACTSMTLQMYAKRKGWDVQNIKVDITETTTTKPGSTVKIPKIEKKIEIKGNLSAAEKQRLEEIAEACPVNKLLTGDKEVLGTFNYVV